MPTFAQHLSTRLHKQSPFAGFDHTPSPQDLQGGGGSDALRQAFEQTRPTLIVELGSWKGASAIFWAQLMRDAGIDGAVLCIDTWLGGLDHLTAPKGPEWSIESYRAHGYPIGLYHQFLANVKHRGLEGYIVPLPATSTIGCRWLAGQGIAADLIYVDASHEEDDVLSDLRGAWDVLRTGGVLCGDDWSAAWYGVICAVNRFRKEKDAGLQVQGTHWFIPKGLSRQQEQVLGLVEQKLNSQQVGASGA